jgi:hypothetical protein
MMLRAATTVAAPAPLRRTAAHAAPAARTTQRRRLVLTRYQGDERDRLSSGSGQQLRTPNAAAGGSNAERPYWQQSSPYYGGAHLVLCVALPPPRPAQALVSQCTHTATCGRGQGAGAHCAWRMQLHARVAACECAGLMRAAARAARAALGRALNGREPHPPQGRTQQGTCCIAAPERQHDKHGCCAVQPPAWPTRLSVHARA